MKCIDCEKLFQYVHRMLPPDEAEVVRGHLAGCADCARVASEYGALDAALEDWNVAEPSPWFDTRVRARVSASGRENLSFFGFGRFRLLAAGVAALAVILALVVVFSHRGVVENQQPVAASSTPQKPATIQVARRPVPAEEQLRMDENLRVLEDYEVVASFDALSELPQANEN